MKVKELIKILKTCNPEHDVVLQKDSEGNGYEELRCWETDLMFNSKEGEVYTKESTDSYDEYMPNCLVLAP